MRLLRVLLLIGVVVGYGSGLAQLLAGSPCHPHGPHAPHRVEAAP